MNKIVMTMILSFIIISTPIVFADVLEGQNTQHGTIHLTRIIQENVTDNEDRITQNEIDISSLLDWYDAVVYAVSELLQHDLKDMDVILNKNMNLTSINTDNIDTYARIINGNSIDIDTHVEMIDANTNMITIVTNDTGINTVNIDTNIRLIETNTENVDTNIINIDANTVDINTHLEMINTNINIISILEAKILTLELEVLPTTNIVTISPEAGYPECGDTNECYLPYTISITAGESVMWVNSVGAHTVVSGFLPGGYDDIFGSGLIGAGDSFEVTFNESGEYPYFCMIHPWMTGSVIVS